MALSFNCPGQHYTTSEYSFALGSRSIVQERDITKVPLNGIILPLTIIRRLSAVRESAMSPIKIALEKPAHLTTASKYTVFNGFVSFGLGVLLILWPGSVQTFIGERAYVGDEQSLFRAMGMAVSIIGYYLLVGGHSGSRQTTAASVIRSITIVPLVLLLLS